MTTVIEASAKELLAESVRELPDKITLAEAIEELQILEGIIEGQRAAAEGRFITHEELRRQMKSWTRK